MTDEFDDDGLDDERPDDEEGAGPTESKPGMDDYQVGYRKPPRHSQFKPGQSGNPRGRKKGSRGLKTDLHAELNRIVEVKVGKYTFKGTTQQLTLRTLALLAANGNLKASAQLVPLVLNLFGAEDRGADKRKLSPQDQAVLDSFLTAFGGAASGDRAGSEAGEPEAKAEDGGANGQGPPPPAGDAADDDPEDL